MRTPKNQRPAPAIVNRHIDLLHHFVQKHGHQWKTKLRRKWLTDLPVEQAWMRQLRNELPISTFGAITTGDIERWHLEHQYRDKAWELHACEDTDIGAVGDTPAVVSLADDGAWVQAWVWVPASAINPGEGDGKPE